MFKKVLITTLLSMSCVNASDNILRSLTLDSKSTMSINDSIHPSNNKKNSNLKEKNSFWKRFTNVGNKIVNKAYTVLMKEIINTSGKKTMYEYNFKSKNKNNIYNDFVLISNSEIKQNNEYNNKYNIEFKKQIKIPQTIKSTTLLQNAISKLVIKPAQNYILELAKKCLLQSDTASKAIEFVAEISGDKNIKMLGKHIKQEQKGWKFINKLKNNEGKINSDINKILF